MDIDKIISEYPRPALNMLDRGVFVANLRYVHAIIRASEPLLLGILGRDMPATLRQFYKKHAEEEHGHAEWLAEDLASLDAAPAKIDWNAAQLAGTQYYLMKHAPPEALLGYMAVLESSPAPLPFIEGLERVYGEKALRTWRYHAEHDVGHAAEIMAAIEGAANQDCIEMNARLTASMVAHGLRSL